MAGKVLIAHRTTALLGGTERAIDSYAEGLRRAGTEVRFLVERPSGREDHDRMSIDRSKANLDTALRAVADWSPDVVWTHALDDLDLEEAVLDGFPSVASIHDYRGMCISGAKCFHSRAPCSKPLGPGCLALYMPMRCGGANPITMLRRYRDEQRRLELLRRYRTRIVYSRHMQRELGRHELDSVVLPLPTAAPESFPIARPSGTPLELLFVGRIERTKGLELAIDAVARAASEFGVEANLTVAGDGVQRAPSQARAQSKLGRRARFLGWVGRRDLQELYGKSDFLLLPSSWPEPFGLVGVEAAAQGLPAIAFDVGGVRDWLKDGVTGILAGSVPSECAFADALRRASTADRAALSSNAYAFAQQYAASDATGNALLLLASATREAREPSDFARPRLRVHK